MRLLHFDALDRLIFTDFRGKPILPYALQWHRWSDSEILIQDISSGNYARIRLCAGQAAKDGMQYFWIDSCCIDSWDNDERSKAINSMFQWYQTRPDATFSSLKVATEWTQA
jgi:hypothetical protein